MMQTRLHTEPKPVQGSGMSSQLHDLSVHFTMWALRFATCFRSFMLGRAATWQF